MENLKSPQRTCIICRKKNEKSKFFRIVSANKIEYSFDKLQKIQSRGSYICKDIECLEKLSKNKKIKMNQSDILTMLKILKKENKNFLNLLNVVKNSNMLTIGIKLVIDDIKNVKLLIIASDINLKNDKILTEIADKNGIKYIHTANKKDLGKIFNKEELNVIGIKDLKIASGFID